MEEVLTIRDRIADEVGQGFQKATTVIGSHANDIIGEQLGGVIDDVKNLASGAFDFIQGSMKTVFGFGSKDTDEEILEETENQTGILNKILNVFKLQNLEDKRKFDKPKGFLGDILAMAGLTLALLLSPFISIANFFKELSLNWRMLKLPTFKKLFYPIKKIIDFFNVIGLSILDALKHTTNVDDYISKFKNWTIRTVEWFKNIFISLEDTVPFFKKITGLASKFGVFLGRFAVISTIIMGLFDGVIGAIDGFKTVDGSMFEKIMSGVKGALVGIINGLINIPLDLLKDLSSWVLSKLGFENTSKILDSFSFETLFTDGINLIWDGMTSILSKLKDTVVQLSSDNKIIEKMGSIKTWIGEVGDNLGDRLDAFIKPITNLLSWFNTPIETNISDSIESIKTWMGNIISRLGDRLDTLIRPITNLLSWFNTPIETNISDSVESIKTWMGNISDGIGNMFDLLTKPITDLLSWFNTPMETKISDSIESIKTWMGNIISRLSDRFDLLTKPITDLLSWLNTPIETKISEGFDLATKIKDKFIEVKDKILKWFEDKVSNIIDSIDPIKGIGKKLKSIGKFFTGDDKEPSEMIDDFETVNRNVKPVKPIPEMQEMGVSHVTDSQSTFEIKRMSDKLDRTLRELNNNQKQNNKQQTQLNQSIVSSNNMTTGGSNNIPEENKWVGIDVMNGAIAP